MKTKEVIPKDYVLAELNNICQSSQFKSSNQLKKILIYLVCQTLDGKQESIKAYSIATEALGRRDDFDPSSDSIVRAQTHRIRTKLHKYYSAEHYDSGVVIELPLNSYIPHFRYSARIDKELFDNSPVLQTKWKHSLTVVPFVSMTPGDDYNHLALGISEQISAALSKFQDLDVINVYPNAAGHFLPEVSRGNENLKNRFLLEGSYYIIDNSMRINVRLSNMEQGAILWAETLDFIYDSSNLFRLQDKIVESILKCIAGDDGQITQYLIREASSKDPENLEVYEAVARYFNYSVQATLLPYNEARKALELCISRYNTCPPIVYAALGDLYVADYKWGFDFVSDAIDKAAEYIERALTGDFNLQTAHLAKAHLAFVQRDKEALYQSIEKAINLNPNNIPIVSLCVAWYARSGHWEEGCSRLNLICKNMNGAVPYYWFHLPFFMYHFKLKEYQKAYSFFEKYKLNDKLGLSEYYSIIIKTKLGKENEIAADINNISKSSIPRTGKMERIFRSYTFDNELCDTFLKILSRYNLT